MRPRGTSDEDGAERADERGDLSGVRVLHGAERYVGFAASSGSYPSCRSISATSGRIARDRVGVLIAPLLGVVAPSARCAAGAWARPLA